MGVRIAEVRELTISATLSTHMCRQTLWRGLDTELVRYYASTQSRARTPEERSVVTLRTAPSSPERSRHRCTRSSPKFSLRWLAAYELGTRTVRVDPSS